MFTPDGSYVQIYAKHIALKLMVSVVSSTSFQDAAIIRVSRTGKDVHHTITPFYKYLLFQHVLQDVVRYMCRKYFGHNDIEKKEMKTWNICPRSNTASPYTHTCTYTLSSSIGGSVARHSYNRTDSAYSRNYLWLWKWFCHFYSIFNILTFCSVPVVANYFLSVSFAFIFYIYQQMCF